MERHFHEEFKALREKLFQMGLLVEGAIEKAVEALLKRSPELTEQVFEDEKLINQLEIEIDEKGHSLFALSQPVASDLRLLTMILKINTDLERMGDHAVNIAQKSQVLIGGTFLKPSFSLEAMTNDVQKMVRNALDSFMNENVDLARKVLSSDDVVDRYNDTLYTDMTELMQKDPSKVQQALSLVMIGHNLERIADLANNIAEDTIYLKQGKEVRHHFETT
ncbi:MAG TPA: phosphate signaling complex protein PhoU [Candidatus Omnitrophota bacterium]|nr:phosphate signaling complex protein PhoU [Candidatus Omnitrophota bacterium]HRY85334.1 phosphate signaling complex protein PhoU [Candidatus Omnitrophota bacterium]